MDETGQTRDGVRKPARDTDRDRIVGLWRNARWPSGEPMLDDSWLGIVQVIWWYHDPVAEQIELAASGGSERIIDAAKVLSDYHKERHGRPPLHVIDGDRLSVGTWAARAANIEALIAARLGVNVDTLPSMLDRMRQHDRWYGRQRQNLIGAAFRTLVHETLVQWGNPTIEWEQEVKADDWFPGIKLPGRSRGAKMDVAAIDRTRLRSTLSCKWGFRHDRISDPTNECQEYSGAARRRQWPDYDYWLVTNELDGQRLNKAIEQTCMAGVVHLNPELVTLAGGDTKDLERAKDDGRFLSLPDFVRTTHDW